MQRHLLVEYLDDLLEVSLYEDYCPNGLQVEGKREINRIVCGVTACQALLDVAVEQKADAVLVHHGIFWHGQSYAVHGPLRKRLSSLLENEINLLAYHLPLDAHIELGNNAQLAQRLNVKIQESLPIKGVPNLLWLGELTAIAGDVFADQIQQALNRAPLHIANTDRKIQRIAWCTGAAQRYLDDALAYDIDAYLTGEVSEQTVHTARENKVHFFAAGHHATERYGVQALGERLKQTCDLECHYVEIENPV